MRAIPEERHKTTHPDLPPTPPPSSEATCIKCQKLAGYKFMLMNFCICGGYKMHNECWREMKKSTTTWDQTKCPVCDARFQASRGPPDNAAAAGPPTRRQRDNHATAQGQELPEWNSHAHFAPGRPYPTGMPNSHGSYPDTGVSASVHPFQKIIYSSSAPTFGVPRTPKGGDVGRAAPQKSDGKKEEQGHEAHRVLQTTTGMAISVSAKEPRNVEDDKATPISLRGNLAGTPEPIAAPSEEVREATHPDTPPTPPSPGEGGAGVKQVLSFTAVNNNLKKLVNNGTTCFKCKRPGEGDTALVAYCPCNFNLMHPTCWEETREKSRNYGSHHGKCHS